MKPDRFHTLDTACLVVNTPYSLDPASLNLPLLFSLLKHRPPPLSPPPPPSSFVAASHDHHLLSPPRTTVARSLFFFSLYGVDLGCVVGMGAFGVWVGRIWMAEGGWGGLGLDLVEEGRI